MLRYLSQSFRTLFISAVATPAHGSPNFYLQFAKNTPCPSTKYFYSGPGRTTDPVEPFSDADATTTPVIPPPRKYRKWPLADSAFVKKEVDRAKAAGEKPRWTWIGKQLAVPRQGCHVQAHYEGRLDPSFNRGPWTADEEALMKGVLVDARLGHRPIRWRNLSRQMNRTVRSLQNWWYTYLNATGGKWTMKEDALIRWEGLRSMREGRIPNWAQVGLKRHSKFISSRWWGCLHPQLHRKGWTAEMERSVIIWVEEAQQKGLPPNWAEMGRRIGKTGPHVQNKWCNNLNSELKKGEWTEGEVHILMDLRSRGTGWVAIGKELNRSARVVQYRYYAITKQMLNREKAGNKKK